MKKQTVENFKVIIQPLQDQLFDQKNVSVSVLREDLIHPLTGGNKWRKLKYNLQAAREQNHHTIITFGGAYSNYLVATAVAGKEYEFKTIGLVRGEPSLPLNKSLQIATDHGMQLHYLSRSEYRYYRDINTHHELQSNYGHAYILPEGGSNNLAVTGCCEMLSDTTADADIICVATATGATLAGITSSLKPHQQAIGFSVLKNSDQVNKDVKQWLIELQIYQPNYILNDEYHFGGYAKTNDELIRFTGEFTVQHNILIEPIYTGKLFYGIYDLISKNYFKEGSRILAIHTGGLQYLGT